MGVLARKLLSDDAPKNIEYVGGKVSSKAGATSGNSTLAINSGLTGGIASGASSGDFVIAIFGTGAIADRTLSITDGTNAYNIIGSELWVDDSSDTNLLVCYKFITSDTDVTFGPTGDAAESGALGIMVFRNVNTSNPFDVTTTTATGANSMTPNPPAITPSTAGAFIVGIGATGQRRVDVTVLTSSNMIDVLSVLANNDSYYCLMAFGHKDDWTSGAFDPVMENPAGGNSFASWAAMTIALRPA
jgi:hypothetical protein